ncbi:amidohydrolase family protein [Streptomyces cacaoi]|uniref:Amidohydrolase n=1 Tax=Streptomyces cacaoi TaxID=1898 RepID=A0A4Y3QYN7_STRCI|nr:amidohydrolase family protein [Streptomyces cacaoi]NNG83587.1 amidohydrolase family protein [Streptomyces cacaoi]GEB50079.1 amidohydrolase [Streptomyces cacaoi]
MGVDRKLVTGGHVITMDEEWGEVPEGAVLIEDDRIVAVTGRAEEFDGVDAERVDAAGGTVLPGLIDSHRHTWLSLLRGVSADQSLVEFLATTFHGTGALLGADELGIASTVGALDALDSGITTVLDCCDCVDSPAHADAAVTALRAAGIRFVYAYGMQEYDVRPPAFTSHAQRLADARRVREEHFPSDAGPGRMAMLYGDFGLSPFADTAAEIRTADELGILGASHTGAATGSVLLRGLRELDDHGLLRPGHLHIHCPALTDREWRLLAGSGGRVSIAPETEMQMGMGRPPFRAALDHGLAPALSTDIVCVGSGDLFAQMRLALQMQRCLDHEVTHRSGAVPLSVGLGVRSALTWATRNGADALGLGSQIGSLTVGKKADLVVVAPRMDLVRPSHRAGTVVLHSSAADVRTVLVDGRYRKRDGRLVGQDLAAVRRRANSALDRIESAARAVPAPGPAGLGDWFARAERAASVHFAQAYTDGPGPAATAHGEPV